MSIASKLASAFKPAPENTPDDPELERAIDSQHKAEAAIADLFKQVEAQTRVANQLMAAKQAAGLAAIEGRDDTAWKKAAADLASAELKLETMRDAEEGARARLRECQIETHRVTVDARVKTQRRINGQRVKAATDCAEAIAAYSRAFDKLAELGEKNLFCWPEAIVGSAPQGAALWTNELREVIERELCRVAKTNFIQGPDLPGARWDGLSGNPREFLPLVEVIEAANSYLLSKIQTPPSVAPVPPEPAQADPGASIFTDQVPAKVEVINENPTEFPPVAVQRSYEVDHRATKGGQS